MKIVNFIEWWRAGCSSRDVVQRILRHCGLCEGPIRTLASARAPRCGSQRDPDQASELQLALDSEFLQAEYLEAQAAQT